MIRDLEVDAIAPDSPDFIIVGAGVAGLALAVELNKRGHTVVICESGGFTQEPSTQDLYNSVVSGLRHSGIHSGRHRIYGGTGTAWGGQALPLAERVFTDRAEIGVRGWPISFEEVNKWYPQATEFLGLDWSVFATNPWSEAGITRPNFGDDVKLCFSQWSPSPNVGASLRESLSRSRTLTVILHANLVSVDLSGRAVSSFNFRALHGQSLRLSAAKYILCCGAIETARLLLAVGDGKSIGNESGLVGKYFQDHISINAARIEVEDRARFQDIFANFLTSKGKLMPKLILSPDVQKSAMVGDVGAHIRIGTPRSSASAAAKDFARTLRYREAFGKTLLAAAKAVKHLPGALPEAWQIAAKRRVPFPTESEVFLEAHCEQEPSIDSCVRLSGEVDALGMPRTDLHWEVSKLSRKGALVIAERVDVALRTLGLGRAVPVPDAMSDETCVLGDLFHHMGTTRMSADAAQGVVNENLRMHEIDNLYIGSASVFPSGGWSNPTLTLLALIFRLADHLLQS